MKINNKTKHDTQSYFDPVKDRKKKKSITKRAQHKMIVKIIIYKFDKLYKLYKLWHNIFFSLNEII